jgi:hypothetical protein
MINHIAIVLNVISKKMGILLITMTCNLAICTNEEIINVENMEKYECVCMSLKILYVYCLKPNKYFEVTDSKGSQDSGIFFIIAIFHFQVLRIGMQSISTFSGLTL